MALLNFSRAQIYGLIRTSRLATVAEGRRRLVPAESITDCVQLLGRNAGRAGDGHETYGGRGGLLDSRRAAGDNHGCFRWQRDLLDVDNTGGV